MEYYDGHFDFTTFHLILPGFHVNAFKLWDGQMIRFSCMSRETKEIYCTFVLELTPQVNLESGSNLHSSNATSQDYVSS